MALSALTVLEVRTGGSDTNGGGFVTGATGTDWSLQNAAQYAVTDGVTAGTTTITSLTAAFGTDVVGNLIYVQGGTGAVVAGWYQIISRTNATTIVVDRATGLTAGTGVTLNIGGALLSPAVADSIATVAGMIKFLKYNASAFVITSASSNVAGGVMTPSNSTITCGYDTTRSLTNTDANRPTIQINSGLSTTVMFNTNTPTVLNLVLDGNGQTSSRCSSLQGTFYNCTFKNFTNSVLTNGRAVFCLITGCSTVTAMSAGACLFCEATGNTVTPFSNCETNWCISYANTGASTDGFNPGTASSCSHNCNAYGNGRDGFRSAGTGMLFTNCISEGNTGFGFNQSTTGTLILRNCASYNNTSGRNNTATLPIVDFGAIIGSGSFFANAAGGDFSLNNAAGGGALARAGVFPVTFPSGLTATFLDAGAAQHQDSPVTLVNTTTNVFLEA